MKDFLRENFSVLLLAFMGLGAWAGTIHLMHSAGMDASNVAWAREQSASIIGALLGLLTGYKAGQMAKSAPPPSAPPKPPAAPDVAPNAGETK